jgi:hypothetical protein
MEAVLEMACSSAEGSQLCGTNFVEWAISETADHF